MQENMYSGYDIEVPKPRIPLLVRTKVTNFYYLVSIHLIMFVFQLFYFNLKEFKEIKSTISLFQGLTILFILVSFLFAFLLTHVINGITNLFGISVKRTEYVDYDLREGRSYEIYPQLEYLWETKEEFDKFQMKVYKKLTQRKIDVLALISTGIVVFIILFLYRPIFKHIDIGTNLGFISSLAYFIFLTIYMLWLFSGWFSGLNILLLLTMTLAWVLLSYYWNSFLHLDYKS